MNKHAICVVDDQEEVQQRVRRFLGDRFVLGVGASVEEAMRDLRFQGVDRPKLFLIDMYFPEGPTSIDDPAAALNKAKAQVLKAEAKLYELLAKLRQTADVGFREARQAREQFRVPVAFFCGKATVDNVIRAYEEERADAVIKKPDPAPNKAASARPEQLPDLYDDAFAQNAERIAASIERAIFKSRWWVRRASLIAGFLTGCASSALVSVLFSFLASS